MRRRSLRFLSVCSGIEAASVAWHPLGWKAVAYSEIDAAPQSVLAHRYPDVPNWGDMTRFEEWPDAVIDVLVGGTPCQSFSVAGLRGGLADARGNLALVYLRLAARYRPRWILWENVPGVLSSNGGGDFGAFLGGLAELGYGFAYRVLDAQYFGLAQRRKRVFVVGCLGDWRRAAAVLFEPASLRGDPAPRREAREGIAVSPTLRAGGNSTGGDRPPGTDVDTCDSLIVPAIAASLRAQGNSSHRADAETYVAHSLRSDGFDASEDGTGRGIPLIAASLNAHASRIDAESETFITQPYTLAIRGRGDSHDLEYRQDGVANAVLTPNGGRGGIGVGAIAFDTTQITSPDNRCQPKDGDPCHPLSAHAHAPAIAYGIRSDASRDGAAKTPSADAEGRVRLRDHGLGIYTELAPTIDASQPHTVAFNARQDPISGEIAGPLDTDSGSQALSLRSGVRRLTPKECERLQGFPDDYTLVEHRGKPMADGPRYKCLGNSMAVPVIRWIGARIMKEHAR